MPGLKRTLSCVKECRMPNLQVSVGGDSQEGDREVSCRFRSEHLRQTKFKLRDFCLSRSTCQTLLRATSTHSMPLRRRANVLHTVYRSERLTSWCDVLDRRDSSWAQRLTAYNSKLLIRDLRCSQGFYDKYVLFAHSLYVFTQRVIKKLISSRRQDERLVSLFATVYARQKLGIIKRWARTLTSG